MCIRFFQICKCEDLNFSSFFPIMFKEQVIDY
jgi:hypothetical protein